MSVDAALNLISILGGPTLRQRDVEQIQSTDDGKALLTWIANLVGPGEHPTNDGRDYVGSNEERQARMQDERRVYAALQGVMLEPEERARSMRSQVARQMLDAPGHMSTNNGSYEYMTPSESRRHAQFIEAETKLVHEETQALQYGITSLKAANKSLKRRNELLQRTASKLEAQIHAIEQQLSDLSIDCTVQSSTAQCDALLVGLGCYFSNGDDPFQSKEGSQSKGDEDLRLVASAVNQCREGRSQVTSFMQACLKQLKAFEGQEQAYMTDVYAEGARLQKALSRHRSWHKGLQGEDEQLILEELTNICAVLDVEADKQDVDKTYRSNVLANLMSEIDDYTKGSPLDPASNVREVLRQAWALDQMDIMRQHESHLDLATSRTEQVLEPLERVYSLLTTLIRKNHDAEAVVEVAIEDLGDIIIPAPSGQGDEPYSKSEIDVEIGSNLKELLIRNPATQKSESSPTARLIAGEEDLVHQVRLVQEHIDNLDVSEREWVQQVLSVTFSRPVHPALHQFYTNSPWNDSPPFSFPEIVQKLYTEASEKVNELQALSRELDEEVRSTLAEETVRKRLTAFVGRWSKP